MGNKITEAIEKAKKARPGWMLEADLVAIAKRLPEGEAVALEIGTGYGMSSVFMASFNPEMLIYTVDNLTAKSLGGGKDKEKCRTIIRRNTLDYPNIHFLEADSRKIEWEKPIDFLFIDGVHSYDFVKSDFERFSSFVKTGGYVAFHDYNVARVGYDVKKYITDMKLPVEVEANVAFWRKIR